MIKIYFFIAIGLITVWILTWFGVKSMYKSLDRGEEGKFVKMFIPKDFQRDLEMIERQAQRKEREAQRMRETETALHTETGHNNENSGQTTKEEDK